MSRSESGAGQAWRRVRPPVAVAIGILVAGVVGMNLALLGLHGILYRPPVPLARELSRIPERLGNFELETARRFAPQTERVLGTTQYLARAYRDVRRSFDEPGAGISLQVVYYSGTDETMWIRHVPEACYVGEGVTPVESVDRKLELGPRRAAGLPEALPIHLFRYQPPGESHQVYTAFYFFIANGRYAANRRDLRLSLMDLRSPHSYYCKVELQPGSFHRLIEASGERLQFAGGVSDAALSLRVVREFLAAALPEIVRCLPPQTPAE